MVLLTASIKSCWWLGQWKLNEFKMPKAIGSIQFYDLLLLFQHLLLYFIFQYLVHHQFGVWMFGEINGSTQFMESVSIDQHAENE